MPEQTMTIARPAAVFTIVLTFCVLGIALWPAPGASGNDVPPRKATAEEIAFFESKVRPVLFENCMGCHGKDAQMGGLRLDSFAGLLKGGNSGTSLTPGDPEKSLLIEVIRHTGPIKMPQGSKLKPEQIAALEAWVKMGAPWPSSGNTEVKTREPGKMARGLWSLQPVTRPAVPKVKTVGWAKTPIDAFVLAKLEAKGLKPAPFTDRRTLLRRVSYDLTGLPPTANEVAAFIADKSPDAYEKVVDRLLASPRYGERWGRHWLDVARYADTKGYVFNEDRNYYNAYTYRDWVIAAFNKDLPYDRFILEQLAADRLPDVQNGEDKRPLAALGFLTIGRRFLNQQPDIIDDRIDVTMRGFQGLTVACARCHDHKFDPVPTQDYYSLYAVFASSNEATLPISDKSLRDPWEKHNATVTENKKAIARLIREQVKRLRTFHADAEQSKTLSQAVKDALQSFREHELPDGDKLKTLEPVFEADAQKELIARRNALADLDKAKPQTPEMAMAMVDNQNPAHGRVFRRGNPANLGDEAPRRFLLAVSRPGSERPVWEKGSGRLELAQAIASKENPLTARVWVNRVWMHHFGAGIVRTPSDFGRQGEPPTHPELLDYLASWFMDNGWSTKKLHRLILLSAAYRQSSDVTPQAFLADPENRLVSRMNRRRLDIEQMRDSLILAAKRLDTTQVGGKSVQLWEQPFSGRRAVYGFIERQNLPGIFRTFDFASPDTTSAGRFKTTVPQQALFFLNSPFVVEQARALIERPDIKNAPDDLTRIKSLYRILFGRGPSADELALGKAFLEDSAPPRCGGLSTPHPVPNTQHPISAWAYGYGEFNGKPGAEGRVTAFTPFQKFTGEQYQGGEQFPDANLHYLMLNAVGGHPGQGAGQAAIRRWVALNNTEITITGKLEHRQPQGDGVRLRIVSSQSGLLGESTTHNGEANVEMQGIKVQKGETIDFVVDSITGDAYDSFSFAPIVTESETKVVWNAREQFKGPDGPTEPLSRTVRYAQALLMTNEFLFVD